MKKKTIIWVIVVIVVIALLIWGYKTNWWGLKKSILVPSVNPPTTSNGNRIISPVGYVAKKINGVVVTSAEQEAYVNTYGATSLSILRSGRAIDSSGYRASGCSDCCGVGCACSSCKWYCACASVSGYQQALASF